METYPASGTSASLLGDDVFAALLHIHSYQDGDLRSLLHTLMAEEQEISKRRRVRHGQIDLLREELNRRKPSDLGSR
jgi:hypothetical protein